MSDSQVDVGAKLLLLEIPAIGSNFSLKASAKIQPQRLESPAQQKSLGRLLANLSSLALRKVQGTILWPRHCIGQVHLWCCSLAVQWGT